MYKVQLQHWKHHLGLGRTDKQSQWPGNSVQNSYLIISEDGASIQITHMNLPQPETPEGRLWTVK